MEQVYFQGEQGYIKVNNEQKYVELYFNERPQETIITSLKVLQWRYYNKKRCWYNKLNNENMQLAMSLCGSAHVEPVRVIDYYLGPENLLVVTSFRRCIYKEHLLRKGTASINVLRFGRVVESIMPVFFCEDCGIYYMLENDFEKISKNETLCVRVLTEIQYRSISTNGWEPISILRSFGYSVSKSEGLSDRRRQEILAFLVENDIIPAARIIDYLAWFCRTHQKQRNMEDAIAKWEEDRAFITNYIPGDFKIQIKMIYRTKVVCDNRVVRTVYV